MQIIYRSLKGGEIRRSLIIITMIVDFILLFIIDFFRGSNLVIVCTLWCLIQASL